MEPGHVAFDACRDLARLPGQESRVPSGRDGTGAPVARVGSAAKLDEVAAPGQQRSNRSAA
jgi:hypothetical protein